MPSLPWAFSSPGACRIQSASVLCSAGPSPSQLALFTISDVPGSVGKSRDTDQFFMLGDASYPAITAFCVFGETCSPVYLFHTCLLPSLCCHHSFASKNTSPAPPPQPPPSVAPTESFSQMTS